MIIGFLGMFIPIILAAPFVPDTNRWEYKLWHIVFSREYFDMTKAKNSAAECKGRICAVFI